MPEQDEFTQPAAVPPIIDPTTWEDYQGFRESTLLWFTDTAANAALRTVGQMLYELVLDWSYWPKHPEGIVRTEVRAAVADLRCLEGFLGSIGREHKEAGLDPFDAHLSRLAGKLAPDVAVIANRLEQELGSWRGEER